jgi:2-polyprenyl-6-methoxyphenol hydroxylase-like FAD-dependent oxidoreductase
MTEVRSHAVVMGASMAGLLAARALSNHFARVTLLERDVLPRTAEARKGVPQGAHAHGLLASGYRVLDRYFPGMMDELAEAGAPRGDVVGDFLWFQYGRWKLRRDLGLTGIVVSRPCLEAAVRERVKAIANVSFSEGVDIVGPVFEPTPGCVSGVVVRERQSDRTDMLTADLVVDATGRGSQSPEWLEEWGFERPPETVLRVDVGYATRVFERREGDFYSSVGGIVAGTPPEQTRYAAILAAEGERWVVTLAGMVKDYPPADEAGWLEYARSLPIPEVYELVARAKPLTEIVSYRFPANQRRYYERMQRFPAGYLVTGDAICSFNPIYGQGMSVAAAEAAALDEVLASGDANLARRFFRRAKPIVDIPWVVATGEDLRYPQVEGKRAAGSGLLNRYLERVHAAASTDPVVCRRFFEVANLLAPPPSLLKPGIAWRVLGHRAPRGPGSPVAVR